MRLAVWALLAALLALAPLPAFAQADGQPRILDQSERIKRFESAIDIRLDGSMHVRETIVVEAAGDRIKRGIFRDFPTRYRDRFNNLIRVGFDVVGVTRDGRPEPYATESISNGVRVRIGDKDVFLNRGEHVYVIEYDTTRQLGFFKDFDELYWNVTGNAWEFVIESAEVTISLPGGAQMLNWSAYTGVQGTTGPGDAALVENMGSSVRIKTTRLLGFNEGLTVAVSWPKGFVQEPSSAERTGNFFADNGAILAGLLGVLGLLGYYYSVWSRDGRDPDGGVVIPRFAPPKDFSPAATRFVRRMGYDRKAFAAAILSMAVKGAITIEDDDGDYALKKTGKGEGNLSPGERRLYAHLLGVRDEIELKQKNHVVVSGAISSLGQSLSNEYEKKYFVTNVFYFAIGIAITIAVVAISVLLTDNPAESAFMSIWIAGFAGASAFLVYKTMELWETVANGAGSRARNLLAAVPVTIMATLFSGATLFGGTAFMGELPWLLPLIYVAAAAINAVFYHLMKAPTALGATIRAEIEGFRMYLGTAEKERMAVLNPPDMTPELFEKYLPYALALDVDHQWSEQFANSASAAGVSDQPAYQPHWYHGNRWERFGAQGFASGLGASLASATAAAATAPGSSSGSGGGGFSGGGGGGGGGGGW